MSDPTDLDDRRLVPALAAPDEERTDDHDGHHCDRDLQRGRACGLGAVRGIALELTELRLDVGAGDRCGGCCCAHFRSPFGLMKLRNKIPTPTDTTITIAYGAHDQL